MIVDTRECWQNLIMDESLGDLQRLRCSVPKGVPCKSYYKRKQLR